jgi:hypothetical protein
MLLGLQASEAAGVRLQRALLQPMPEHTRVELVVFADPDGGYGSAADPATEGSSGHTEDRHYLGRVQVALAMA